MKTPCKNCLVFPICKNRISTNTMYSLSSTVLYVSCSRFKDYFEFYKSQGITFVEGFENLNKQIFGKTYIL